MVSVRNPQGEAELCILGSGVSHEITVKMSAGATIIRRLNGLEGPPLQELTHLAGKLAVVVVGGLFFAM